MTAEREIRALARAIGCERREVAEALAAAGLMPDRPLVPIVPVSGGRSIPVASNAITVEKERIVRSKEYRMAVASLPCIHCGIEGASQCAHANVGKGLGRKVTDLETFPLCHEGANGCHVAFDSTRLLPGGRAAHVEAGRRWAAQTRRKIKDAGRWPAGIGISKGEEA